MSAEGPGEPQPLPLASRPRAAALGRGFGALQVHNFRLWFVGQTISVSGTWMQTTALGWLVVQLTGDGVALGTMLALQYLPLLLLGPLGGSLTDRYDVRHLVIATQTALGLLALVLWFIVIADKATMPVIYLISFLTGVCGMVDNPARRAFVSELVPRDRLASAISLTGVLVNTSRVVGPAIAAIIIQVADVGPCFLVNAISYGCVVVSLLAMRRSELVPRGPRATGPTRMADTLRYVRGIPELRQPLYSMAIVGTLAFEFSVVLPLLAIVTFGGDGSTYGWFLAVLSIGGVLGSIAAGALERPGRWLEGSLLLFGAAMFLGAAAPTIAVELVALFFMGGTGFAFVAIGSTSVQVHAGSVHRGRVLALWSMAFLGSTMVGAPLIGWISQVFGPRAGVAVGGASCLVAAALVLVDRAAPWTRRRTSAAVGTAGETG